MIIRQRDTVALRIFNAGWVAELPPSSQLGHINTIIHTLEDTQPRDQTPIGPLLDDVADRIGRRGIVFLISDCLEDLEPMLAGLRHLRFRGHEVIVFHVLHPDEVEVPARRQHPLHRAGGVRGTDDAAAPAPPGVPADRREVS